MLSTLGRPTRILKPLTSALGRKGKATAPIPALSPMSWGHEMVPKSDGIGYFQGGVIVASEP